MMEILAWVLVGLLAGFLARMVVRGEGPGGLFGDLIIGIAGAVIGGWIMRLLGHASPLGFNIWSVVVAFIGAVILLFVLRLVFGRRATA
jgi:uncharacterized membrane protein YeaQ/YmgE (transglycosylase-associated protein family)